VNAHSESSADADGLAGSLPTDLLVEPCLLTCNPWPIDTLLTFAVELGNRTELARYETGALACI
jgi:hypothetical protein